MKKIPLAVIVISVIMFFVALATDIFWLARVIGKAFPPTMPVEPSIYDAFALPDIVLSLFLYVGAYGLLKLSCYGWAAALVGMGMWLFDSLLVLAITKSARLNIIGPSLFFACFTLIYLWLKKDIFE
ncbi:MAG: hypothetical protein ACE5GI_05910 [Candidatus Aminicenantales bacterium]